MKNKKRTGIGADLLKNGDYRHAADANWEDDEADLMDNSSDSEEIAKQQERFRPVHISNAEWHDRASHNTMKEKRRLHLARAREGVKSYKF